MRDEDKTKEELAQSRAMLQAAIENLPFEFWALGPDRRYLLQNAASKESWGEIVGKRPEDVAGTKQNLSLWLENDRRAFAGEKVEGEVELTIKGETRSFHNVIAPIRDGQRVSGILGVNIDITGRKRAEEALRESESRYRTLAESTTDFIAIVDRNGSLLYANRSAAVCVGLEPGEVAGRQQCDLFPPEMAETHRERIQWVFETGQMFKEDERIRFGSDEVWLDIRLIPLLGGDGTVASVMVVSRNITDRKRTEEALQKARDDLECTVAERTADVQASYAELKALYDGMRDGLVFADVETTRFVRVNTAFCHMLGYSEEEIKALSVSDIHPPEDLPDVLEKFRSQAQGDPDPAVDFRVLRKDGSVFYADIATSCMEYHGRPCLVGFFRDVTHRRQAEEALRKEQRVLKHLLRSSDHERQLIAYEIHDGLAQQLAAALMHFQMCDHLRDTKPAESKKAYDAGIALLRQGHFEARRLISGVRPPILDESGIVAAIAHLVNEQSLSGGPDVEFRSRVTFHRLAPALENAMYRIVQEGLTNACKHSRSPRVRIALLQRGNHARIEIRDWGIGFAPENVGEHCFGLAGIRERARLLGGTCRIESAPAGGGTQVTVELPVVARE